MENKKLSFKNKTTIRQKQLSFFKSPKTNTKKWWIEKNYVYGGSLNYRKCKRPFDSKKLIHLVFKAQLGHSIYFTRSQKYIQKLLFKSANKYGIVLKQININKDHIHIFCYTNIRNNFINFIRYFSAEMGRKYKKIFSQFGFKKTLNLWKCRPFTRLVSWGRQSKTVMENYIKKNELECLELIKYEPRKHKLTEFLNHFTQRKRTPDKLL